MGWVFAWYADTVSFLLMGIDNSLLAQTTEDITTPSETPSSFESRTDLTIPAEKAFYPNIGYQNRKSRHNFEKRSFVLYRHCASTKSWTQRLALQRSPKAANEASCKRDLLVAPLQRKNRLQQENAPK